MSAESEGLTSMVAGIIINRKVKRIMKKIVLSMLLVSGCIFAMEKEENRYNGIFFIIKSDKENLKRFESLYSHSQSISKGSDKLGDILDYFEKDKEKSLYDFLFIADVMKFCSLRNSEDFHRSHTENMHAISDYSSTCFRCCDTGKSTTPAIWHIRWDGFSCSGYVDRLIEKFKKEFPFIDVGCKTESETLLEWMKKKFEKCDDEGEAKSIVNCVSNMSVGGQSGSFTGKNFKKELIRGLALEVFCSSKQVSHSSKKATKLSQKCAELKKKLREMSNKNEQ